MTQNVLVIEDIEDQNKFICKIVEKGGYNPISAFSGTQGFAMLKKHRRGLGFLSPNISAILLDINMPDISGLEFLHVLRREESWRFFVKRIPVIILTAHDTDENRTSSADSHYGLAAKFIVKPFDEKELLDALNSAIKEKDGGSMIAINRELMYERFSMERHAFDMMREAYLNGEENKHALDYLRMKKVEAQKDLSEAKKLGAASEETLAYLVEKERLALEEYERMESFLD